MKIQSRVIIVIAVCLLIGMTACAPAVSSNDTPPSAMDKPAIAMDRSGTYTAGKWTYALTVTHPGTRSQGTMGKLLYNGRALSAPENPGDFYDTPLGRFVHAGMPVVPWGEHGWMPAAAGVVLTGKRLAPPDAADDHRAQATDQMGRLLAELTAGGRNSPYLSEPLSAEEITATDPWGHRYRIYQDLRGGEGGGMVARLELTSAGPDGRFDTDDDIVRASNFIAISTPQNGSIADELTETTGSPAPEAETQP